MPSEAIPALDKPAQPAAPPVATVVIIVAGRRGQVVVATGGVGNGRTAAGVDIDVGAVVDGTAVDGTPPPHILPAPIVFPWFPPELISLMTTMPPSALERDTPPFPARTV